MAKKNKRSLMQQLSEEGVKFKYNNLSPKFLEQMFKDVKKGGHSDGKE